MKVWQRADVLSKEIHKLTMDFPGFEKFELGSQMRRSSASVPDNISEGTRGSSDKDFINFLRMARGSVKELETQIGRTFEAGYLERGVMNKYLKELEEIGKMLSGVIRYLKNKKKK